MIADEGGVHHVYVESIELESHAPSQRGKVVLKDAISHLKVAMTHCQTVGITCAWSPPFL